MSHCYQTRQWNPLTICLSRSRPQPKLKGHWSHFGARNHSAWRARWAWHWCRHIRARYLLEMHTAILLTSLTHKGRALPFGSQLLLFWRPMSACIRYRGLSPMRVLMHTPICGPTLALSPSIQTSISGQHHSSREGRAFTYNIWGASCMLPYQPLKNLYLYFHPHPPFCHHLTPLHARTIIWRRYCHWVVCHWRPSPSWTLEAAEPI